MSPVFIGSIIEQKVKERKMSIAEFASRINRSRTTVYDIFSRKSIDIDLLLTISDALDYDFIAEIYLKTPPKASNRCFIAVEVSPSALQADMKALSPEIKSQLNIAVYKK